MITNIRERNGLSCDFLKNQSEDLTAKRRRKTNYRADQHELFLQIVKDIYDTQEEENRQAFIGEGDFEMSDLFFEILIKGNVTTKSINFTGIFSNSNSVRTNCNLSFY